MAALWGVLQVVVMVVLLAVVKDVVKVDLMVANKDVLLAVT